MGANVLKRRSRCRIRRGFLKLRATALATFQLFHPALSRSLSTVLLQMVFGLSLALRPSVVHPNAVKKLFLLSVTCPNQSVPPSSLSLAAYFIALCHLKHFLDCLSLLPSDLRRLDVTYKKNKEANKQNCTSRLS